jgi:deoxyribodipyrimidine photo-lyase
MAESGLPRLSPFGGQGLRLRPLNDAPVRGEGATHVLYWMTAFRRLEWNPALERAVAWSRGLGLPLLVFEALRLDYPWASLRHHRFCLDGMREHGRRLEGQRTGYFPYVEPERGAGKGLLQALARKAAVAVVDDAPTFFLPSMRAAAAPRLDVRLEAVDGVGLVPLREPGRDFGTAFSFRRHLQRVLPGLLEEAPSARPLAGAPLAPFDDPAAPGPARIRAVLGDDVADRWAPADEALLDDPDLGSLPLDRSVPPAPFAGGRAEASRRLERFLARGLDGYAAFRNHPDRERVSGLSPHLHWGHVSAHEIVHAVLDREGWTPASLADAAGGRKPDGRRQGWWGLSDDAEAFLDQVVTWRELGQQTSYRAAEAGWDPEAFETLPEWAIETLGAHADDPRPHVYVREAFEEARTHDPLWNAAQRELRREGTIHNYLRMLWGKKILEWSASPREALDMLIHLNHRWGVDGRDPNSTSGIMWTFGRYDRGWPEREIYGKVRSMSSRSTRRKVEMERYLARFGDGPAHESPRET